MRLVIGQLLAIVRRYPALVDGAFVIIAWVGIKLLIEYLHVLGFVHFEVHKWLSFGVIVVIFGARTLYARSRGRSKMTTVMTKPKRAEGVGAVRAPPLTKSVFARQLHRGSGSRRRRA